MTICKKCGARKRRWPRSCSACGSGAGRSAAGDGAADVAVHAGLFDWVGRGVTAVVRLVLRLFH